MAEDREKNHLHLPVPTVTAWTSDRRELYQWFTDNAPSLASAYEGAVRLLSAPSFPGRTHMISHVVRDICNRLPDFLGSVERDRLHYDRELEALSEVWPSSIGPSADDYIAGGGEAGGDSHVPIPRAAAAAVSQLLARHRERQSQRDITRDLFSLVSEANEYDRANLEPIVNEFHRIAAWFMERAHLRATPMTEPAHEELVRQFEQFERISLSLIGGFFKTMDDLNDILQQANTRTG
jgi:hypothetical protein